MLQASPSDRHVGLFGGSFNPPHLAHLLVAEWVREHYDLDRVAWIPNFQSPLKRPEEIAPAEHRVAMTRLAIADNERFTLSLVEVRREGVSYTVDTIGHLQDAHPGVEFSLIVGSDSLAAFDAWHRPDEILRRVRLIVYRRPGTEDASPPSGFEQNVTMADAPLLEISGTEIRNRIRSGESIRYMVPEPVRSYIFDRDLYRPRPA